MAEQLLEMLEQSCLMHVPILKVGHHGSRTSSGSDFIETVSPDIAVFSAGKDNSYNHPHKEIIALFEKMNIQRYITYECGNIVISTDGKTYSVATEK